MSAPEPDGTTIWRPAHGIDPRFALVWAKTRVERDGVNWWATISPDGPATVAFRVAEGGVRADAWGPGTDWALSRVPRLLGADDDPSDFDPRTPAVAAMAARFGAIRIGATDRWYEALVTTIIGQRVVTIDAKASVGRLRSRHGSPSPKGPIGHLPDPHTLLTIPDHEFHRLGIERTRARTMRVAAKYADRAERLCDATPPEAIEWLQRLPGIGPWTAGIVAGVAGGDPDAVPIGDLHIPGMVTSALCGEVGDDDRMLELLEPYRGHRNRVVRLIKLAGPAPGRRRPKATRYDISDI